MFGVLGVLIVLGICFIIWRYMYKSVLRNNKDTVPTNTHVKDNPLPVNDYVQIEENKEKRYINNLIKMKNSNFIAIDFETATSNRNACQLGIVVIKEGIIRERLSFLIKPPQNKYNPRCVAIHHITPEMTKDSPTFDEVWRNVKSYFEGNFIVAHKASFDIDTLQKNLDYYGLPYPIIMGVGDTYELTGLKLTEACIAYGVSLNKAHDALSDAEACANLFLLYLSGKMADRQNCENIQNQNNKDYNENTFKGHTRLTGDILKKDLSNADPNNPFYDKKIVITGVFSIERMILAELLKNLGADIDTVISKSTNYVLVGKEPGPSKMEKIDKYNADGCNIKKIYEAELKDILSKYTHTNFF